MRIIIAQELTVCEKAAKGCKQFQLKQFYIF